MLPDSLVLLLLPHDHTLLIHICSKRPDEYRTQKDRIPLDKCAASASVYVHGQRRSSPAVYAPIDPGYYAWHDWQWSGRPVELAGGVADGVRRVWVRNWEEVEVEEVSSSRRRSYSGEAGCGTPPIGW